MSSPTLGALCYSGGGHHDPTGQKELRASDGRGAAGIDDQLLLQKYFAQVLAGATNAAIVVDPAGSVVPGRKAVVPFDLTDADIRADVLVLGQAVRALTVEVIAPDGTVPSPGAGAEEVVGDAFRVLRVTPAEVLPPGVGAGQ